MKAKQEALKISGVVVSKRRERGQSTRVTVLCGDGSKVDLRHKKMDTIPFAMVCDILPGDWVDLEQGDLYTLKVTANPARYQVDGGNSFSLSFIVSYNPDLSEESIEAIARLEVGESFEEMHAATILRIK